MVKITSFLTGIVIALGLATLDLPDATATPFTPLEWQREVKEHADSAFRGQRKHLTWIRDKDRNFIDDEIQARFRQGQLVNVVVDLNTCLTPPQIRDLLSKFGKITYIGKLVTFALLEGVRVEKLRQLAALPQVAMIEWQTPMKLMVDVSSRAIQSRSSTTYSPNTAQDVDLPPLCSAPSGCTGQGVHIAIVDTGVDNTHKAFTGKFKTGYGASSNTNNDSDGHGTHVAGIALGKALATAQGRCRTPGDGSSLTDYCGGVATGADLVDVKVCQSINSCSWSNIYGGLEWLATYAGTVPNRVVANLSLAAAKDINTGFCPDDDDTSVWAQEVNRLVGPFIGIVVVAAHGNASNCGFSGFLPGHYPRRTPAPGAASGAITVQAVNDQGTVNRNNDSRYSETLLGPRKDVDLSTGLPVSGLKPDISAPGVQIRSATAGGTTHEEYRSLDGTSMATAHVAGAAAVVLQARPDIDPGSLKALFQQTADSTLNGSDLGTPPYPTIPTLNAIPFPPLVWVPDFGFGIINLFAALAQATADVGFPNCIGPPATPGGLCQVTDPQQPYSNIFDIATTAPPQVLVPNAITAQVRNSGLKTANVSVKFGVYEFAAGNTLFYPIGTVQVSIPAKTTISVSQPWTPDAENHSCVQVSIEYALDSNFDNNVTQVNLQVAPLQVAPPPPLAPSALRVQREVRIENPFMVPALMQIRPRSNRDGWICKVSEESFMFDPFEDCPRKLRVVFDAPTDAAPDERANCDIAVYATPKGATKPVLIGGVTAQAFVPKPSPNKTEPMR